MTDGDGPLSETWTASIRQAIDAMKSAQDDFVALEAYLIKKAGLPSDWRTKA